MTGDLERLVKVAEGQAPSAEFVARLRARIVEETEGSDVAAGDTHEGFAPSTHLSVGEDVLEPDDDIAVVVHLDPESGGDELGSRRARTRHRTQRLAAAAAVAVVFIGAWALTSSDRDQIDTVDTVDTVDTSTPTTAKCPIPIAEAGPPPLTAGNTFFEAGTFRIDTLGTAFTFSVEEITGLLLNENGVVLITDLTSRNADDRTITFRRTALLPDPAAPTAEFDVDTGWPAVDLLGWLDRLGDDVTASNPSTPRSEASMPRSSSSISPAEA